MLLWEWNPLRDYWQNKALAENNKRCYKEEIFYEEVFNNGYGHAVGSWYFGRLWQSGSGQEGVAEGFYWRYARY